MKSLAAHMFLYFGCFSYVFFCFFVGFPRCSFVFLVVFMCFFVFSYVCRSKCAFLSVFVDMFWNARVLTCLFSEFTLLMWSFCMFWLFALVLMCCWHAYCVVKQQTMHQQLKYKKSSSKLWLKITTIFALIKRNLNKTINLS